MSLLLELSIASTELIQIEGNTLADYVVVGVSSRAKTINRLAARPSGQFVLIHPNVPPGERHHAKRYTWAKTLKEAVDYIRQGYHARMVNVENGQAEDVIINEHIRVWEFP